MTAELEDWDASPLGTRVLAGVTQAIADAREAARRAGREPRAMDLARAALGSPVMREANKEIADGLMAEYAPEIAAMVAAEAGKIRADAAGEIAAAIEASAPLVGEHHGGTGDCPDCAAYRQAKDDAATARRIGGVS
jgi:acyl-CoA reductase-like NAD-dependent aldehyde dehydrogenase